VGDSLSAMGWVRRAGILVVVAALALGSLGAVAGAKKKHKKKGQSWASQVTLAHPSSTQFTGVVTSKLKACRGSRVVTVSYTDPSTGQTSPLSVQRTDNAGGYQVTLSTPAYAGTYRVRVDQRKIRARKAPQTCKGAESTTVGV
jgi:hypothetical protein